MTHPGFDPRYEPPQVKAALPVEWVLEHFFGVWGAGSGDMIRCPLPGHQDDTASFNLWAPNEDGVPMRFGCFGCGANGDVIDLIRIARGCSFTDALNIAVDELLPLFELEDWTPSDVPAKDAPAPPEKLEAALERWSDNLTMLEEFLRLKELEVPLDFAREVWAWQGAYVGMAAVVFPHYDWDKQLRGVRYRSIRRGTRWTERGSRFDALYGAWLDRGREHVVLTEGETDTAYASWQLRDWPIDVLGLASGAAQKPPAEAVRRLAGRKVFTAFDGDMAGRIATNRWRAALDDVRVIEMPDGEDVCSVGVPLVEMFP